MRDALSKAVDGKIWKYVHTCAILVVEENKKQFERETQALGDKNECFYKLRPF